MRSVGFRSIRDTLRLAGLCRLWPVLALLLVTALGACATVPPVTDARSVAEAQHYVAAAKPRYAPPGLPGDPWGPYIHEASARYDVPESWIRGVMHQESAGRQFSGNGLLTISDKGAMGLMQVMPETYDELRLRYGFSDDPYDPHNNILAGTAFLRELYDKYGMPGLLAAYDAGPGRLDQYLANKASLPDETRHYVAAVAPLIERDRPVVGSAAAELALNRLPDVIPPGLRFRRVAPARWRRVRLARGNGRHAGRMVRLAGLTGAEEATMRHVSQPLAEAAAHPSQHLTLPGPVRLARLSRKPGHGGFHLIGRAMAETIPAARNDGAGQWAVQLGAYGSKDQARAALRALHGSGHPALSSLHQAHHTLWRLRLTGLSRGTALSTCTRKRHGACMVIAPSTES